MKMKSLLVLVIISAALPPPAAALLLACSCVPFIVMFSKQNNNDCFQSDWVRELIDNLAIATLEGWQDASCGGGTGGVRDGVHAFATSYTNSINALQEESEGYIAGSQQGYLIGMNQGFELGYAKITKAVEYQSQYKGGIGNVGNGNSGSGDSSKDGSGSDGDHSGAGAASGDGSGSGDDSAASGDSNSNNVTAPVPVPAPVPTPVPPPPACNITKLVLIDALNDVVLRDLTNGDIIDISVTGNSISIEAKATNTKKVQFDLDGVINYRTETRAPYLMNGNQGSDYFAWPYTLGPHTVSVEAFNAAGTVSPPYVMNFTVIASAPIPAPVPEPVPAPVPVPVPAPGPASTAVDNCDQQAKLATCPGGSYTVYFAKTISKTSWKQLPGFGQCIYTNSNYTVPGYSGPITQVDGDDYLETTPSFTNTNQNQKFQFKAGKTCYIIDAAHRAGPNCYSGTNQETSCQHIEFFSQPVPNGITKQNIARDELIFGCCNAAPSSSSSGSGSGSRKLTRRRLSEQGKEEQEQQQESSSSAAAAHIQNVHDVSANKVVTNDVDAFRALNEELDGVGEGKSIFWMFGYVLGYKRAHKESTRIGYQFGQELGQKAIMSDYDLGYIYGAAAAEEPADPRVRRQLLQDAMMQRHLRERRSAIMDEEEVEEEENNSSRMLHHEKECPLPFVEQGYDECIVMEHLTERMRNLEQVANWRRRASSPNTMTNTTMTEELVDVITSHGVDNGMDFKNLIKDVVQGSCKIDKVEFQIWQSCMDVQPATEE